MPSPNARYPSLHLHQLPTDVLVDLLQRVRDPTALSRLASLSNSNLSAVARSDAVWAPTFQQIWGRSMYDRVLASMQPASEEMEAEIEPVQDEGAAFGNDDLRKLHFERMARHPPAAECFESADSRVENANADVDTENTALVGSALDTPDWISEHSCLSSDQEKTQRECHELWQKRPSLMTAFSCLAKLVPPDFNSDPSMWVIQLTDGEASVTEKARVVASFIHYFSPNRVGVHNVRKAAVQCMTVKSLHDPLSQAIRREYVRNFDVRGMSLPNAMRTLLTYGEMPSEAARICRLLWVFAAEFHCQHGGQENVDRPEPKKSTPEETEAPIPTGGAWVSQDVVYLLMWSLLVLNADAQNPHVKNKMQLHEWVKNTALALHGAGHVPQGVRPDGSLEDAEAGASVPRVNHHQSWGATWGEQHRLRETRVCVNEEVGAAVTASSLQAMYADVRRHPLLPHVSREPKVTKGLQRLTESTGSGGFSISNWTNGLINWMTGTHMPALPVQ